MGSRGVLAFLCNSTQYECVFDDMSSRGYYISIPALAQHVESLLGLNRSSLNRISLYTKNQKHCVTTDNLILKHIQLFVHCTTPKYSQPLRLHSSRGFDVYIIEYFFSLSSSSSSSHPHAPWLQSMPASGSCCVIRE